jgi:DNA-binding protein
VCVHSIAQVPVVIRDGARRSFIPSQERVFTTHEKINIPLVHRTGRRIGELRMAEENTVFVGRKPTMNYVLAVVTQFNGGSSNVVIKARGKAINRAVDVAEIVRNRFVKEAKVVDIKIGTEKLADESGESANVSSIEIYLTK